MVQNQKWVPPREGILKLNVNASVIQGSSTFRVGMILRDYEGHFVQGKCIHIGGEVSPLEVEVFGICEALSWMFARIGQTVQVESDSMVVVGAICNNKANHLEVENDFNMCRVIMRYRPDLSICYVRKQANETAHLMAHVSCKLDSYNLFLSAPVSVLETVVSEYSYCQ